MINDKFLLEQFHINTIDSNLTRPNPFMKQGHSFPVPFSSLITGSGTRVRADVCVSPWAGAGAAGAAGAGPTPTPRAS